MDTITESRGCWEPVWDARLKMVREELCSSGRPEAGVYVSARRVPALMDSSVKELTKPALCEEPGNVGWYRVSLLSPHRGAGVFCVKWTIRDNEGMMK